MRIEIILEKLTLIVLLYLVNEQNIFAPQEEYVKSLSTVRLLLSRHAIVLF